MTQRRQVRQQPQRVQATYTKSNMCRVIHVDGAYGGPTVNGHIYMALFSEHSKLPGTVRFEIDSTAAEPTLRPVAQSASAAEWVREVEVEVILSPSFATSLRDWLDDKIKAINQQGGESYRLNESGTSEE